MKKIILLCLVAVSTMTLFSFKAVAPSLATHVKGYVYDQIDQSTALSGILVEELVNGKAVSRQFTNSDGSFDVSIQTTLSTSTLRFSDPDYSEYLTQTNDFDLSSQEGCNNVSVYMSSSQTE